MPLYEYKCPSCGHEWEDLRRMSDENPKCPKCGEPSEKQVSSGHKIQINEPWRTAKERMS